MEHRELMSEPHAMLRVTVGSRAYGLSDARSDNDVRGVFAAPPRLLFALGGHPTHFSVDGEDTTYYEVEKLCNMCLGGNPSAMELLWTPYVEYASDAGRALIGMRTSFLSRAAIPSYKGFMFSELKRFDKAALSGEVGRREWKMAMHASRMLICGSHVLRTGELLVDLSGHGEHARLMAIRNGQLSIEEFRAYHLRLAAHYERSCECAVVPEHPDKAAVAEFLYSVRMDTIARYMGGV